MRIFFFFLSLGLLILALLHDLNLTHPSEALMEDAIIIIPLFVATGMLGFSIWGKK